MAQVRRGHKIKQERSWTTNHVRNAKSLLEQVSFRPPAEALVTRR